MITSKSRILTDTMSGAVRCIALNCLAQDVPGRWYLGVDTGLALQQDITIEDSSRGMTTSQTTQLCLRRLGLIRGDTQSG